MDKKKMYMIGAIIAALAICGGGYVYYETVYVAAHQVLSVAGNVDVREVSLAFRASDRVDSVFVDEGDSVQAGQMLAKLDSHELEFGIAKLKSQIIAQQAIVDKLTNGSRSEDIAAAQDAADQARAALQLAQATFNRQDALYGQGAISGQEYDKAKSEYHAAKSKLSQSENELQKLANGSRLEDIVQAEATLQALKDELAQQEYVLSQYELKAPVDGIIRSRLLEPGDMASPQKPVFTESIEGKKWIRAYVSESELTKVHEGQQAHVKVDGLGQSLVGQVGYISDTAEFTPKTVQTNELRTALVYEIRVYVDDQDNVLRMGMPATVVFDM